MNLKTSFLFGFPINIRLKNGMKYGIWDRGRELKLVEPFNAIMEDEMKNKMNECTIIMKNKMIIKMEYFMHNKEKRNYALKIKIKNSLNIINPFSATRRYKCHQNKVKVRGLGTNNQLAKKRKEKKKKFSLA